MKTHVLCAAAAALTLGSATAMAGHTRNIVLTGYWPPTNEMLRQFSSNPAQNPGGWVGMDWEGRGYDVYAFFPEFPMGVGQGVGDFEVDYQDTTADWNAIMPLFEPVAIITFSRANSQNGWELESRNRNRTSWTNDFMAPFQPTPSPPDASVPGNHIRFSTLPMQAIVDAVNTPPIGVSGFIDTGPNFGGTYLSEFIGYHGLWWHDDHADPMGPSYNAAAGHIHVGLNTDLTAAVEATEVTLRVLIRHLNQILCTGDIDGDGVTGSADLASLLGAWGTGDELPDIDGDGVVGASDIALMLGAWGDCHP